MTRRTPTWAVPWCHACDREIDEAHSIAAPLDDAEDDGAPVVLIGCARCLTFPTDGDDDAGCR